MDELTLLRRLRPDATPPSKDVLVRAFDLLEARATVAERHRAHHVPAPRRRRRARWTLMVAGAALAVGVMLFVPDALGVVGSGGGASAEAAELLNRAADTTIRTADPVLVAGQYRQVVLKTVHDVDAGSSKQGPVLFSIHEDRTTWIPQDVGATWTQVRFPVRSAGTYWGPGAKALAAQADAWARKQAPEVLHGQGGAFFNFDSTTAPSTIRALPQDPQALLDRIYRDIGRTGSSRDDAALRRISDVLNTELPTANLRAALYKAAALIPGVTVVANSATLDGQQGVAIGRIEPSTGIRLDLIIDADTGQLIGEREVTTRPLDSSPAGTTISWTSVTATVVDAIPKQFRP